MKAIPLKYLLLLLFIGTSIFLAESDRVNHFMNDCEYNPDNCYYDNPSRYGVPMTNVEITGYWQPYFMEDDEIEKVKQKIIAEHLACQHVTFQILERTAESTDLNFYGNCYVSHRFAYGVTS